MESAGALKTSVRNRAGPRISAPARDAVIRVLKAGVHGRRHLPHWSVMRRWRPAGLARSRLRGAAGAAPVCCCAAVVQQGLWRQGMIRAPRRCAARSLSSCCGTEPACPVWVRSRPPISRSSAQISFGSDLVLIPERCAADLAHEDLHGSPCLSWFPCGSAPAMAAAGLPPGLHQAVHTQTRRTLLTPCGELLSRRMQICSSSR